MAIETSEKSTLAFKFDDSLWQSKLVKLTQLQTEHAGKKNYNPFLWFSKEVQPKIDRYNKGDRSKDLFDSLMAINEIVPVINPKYVEEKPIILPPAPRRA